MCRTVWHLRHVRSAFPAVGQPRSLRGCHPVGGSGIILPLIDLDLILELIQLYSCTMSDVFKALKLL